MQENIKNKAQHIKKKRILFKTSAQCSARLASPPPLFIMHALPSIPEFCMRLSLWWIWMAHDTNQDDNDMRDCKRRWNFHDLIVLCVL